MGEPTEPQSESQQFTGGDTQKLLAHILYLLNYYVEHDSDLEPINTAQGILMKLLEVQGAKEEDPLNKGFEVTSVSREDVLSENFPKSLVMLLTDEDMADIARSMGDNFVEFGGYWEDLRQLASQKFREKAREEALNPSGVPLKAFRGEDGKFISYIDGGYPCYYLGTEGSVLCADCANDEQTSEPVVAGDVYYEGEDLECDDCGKDIQSAYGDPYAKEEDTEGNEPENDLPDPFNT